MKTPALLVAATLVLNYVAHAEDPVIVHEWGTFTSLQDENGKAIGGINVDDEPVPDFVYTAGSHEVAALNNNRWTFGLPPYSAFLGKGGTLAPIGDPDVTMRLETPVLYLYPPKGQPAASVPPLDVHVDFHGGILSQYYPYATVLGAVADAKGAVALTGQTMSGLYWCNVRLGSTGEPVATDDKVWTTPRETSAPEIEVKGKAWDSSGHQVDAMQAEHFLFYRGVGHLDSPLHISSTEARSAQTAGPLAIDPEPYPETFKSAGWLADIRADGSCAFTALPAINIPQKAAWIPKGCQFAADDFAAGNLAKLQALMQDGLVKAGLYPDEASAMLRTWELSYFKSPGLRFFYIVPRAWVDNVLPLKITGAPVAITRVMVGRIELISDQQRATLARLAAEPYADLNALKRDATQLLNSSPRFTLQEKADFESGSRPLSELGLTLSPSVRDYLSLGRFRDALIVHEQQKHPSDNFARFIKENDLAAAQ